FIEVLQGIGMGEETHSLSCSQAVEVVGALITGHFVMVGHQSSLAFWPPAGDRLEDLPYLPVVGFSLPGDYRTIGSLVRQRMAKTVFLAVAVQRYDQIQPLERLHLRR